MENRFLCIVISKARRTERVAKDAAEAAEASAKSLHAAYYAEEWRKRPG